MAWHDEPLNIKACLRTECQDVVLQPQEKKDIAFALQAAESGRFTATLESIDKVAYAFVSINVIKVPELSFTNIKPASVAYGEDVRLSFTLKTDSPLHNVNLDLGFDELDVGTIEETKEMTVLTSAKNLINGLKIHVVYSDAAGKVYEDTNIIKIEVKNIPWYAKFIFWAANFFQ